MNQIKACVGSCSAWAVFFLGRRETWGNIQLGTVDCDTRDVFGSDFDFNFLSNDVLCIPFKQLCYLEFMQQNKI